MKKTRLYLQVDPSISKMLHRIKISRRDWLLKLFILLTVTISCSEELDEESYFTFTGETVGDYITNPERYDTYSEYVQLLEMTNTIGLLNAYGKYTCFIPTNDAMHAFYKSNGKTSLDDFKQDSLKKIAYDHIIKDQEVSSNLFTPGFLPYLTMSGRYLRIDLHTEEGRLVYEVNNSSEITNRDIDVHNGIIHTIDAVLAPTENTLVEAIGLDSKFSLFFEALVATGLDQNLTLIEDATYTPPENLLEQEQLLGHGIFLTVPKEKKYGYTAFMESDETYEKHGIHNLEDLKDYAKEIYDQMYPEDAGITDVTDPKNSLNRFIAYHLVNKKLTKQLIIEKYDNTGKEAGTTHSIQTVDMFEYIAPMCPNTLIEVRTLRTTNEYNIFNMLESGEAIRLTDDFDNDAVNGVYHEIDNILAYTTEVEQMLSTKRLRMDAASFLPELTNNNMRIGQAYPGAESPNSVNYIFPPGYFENVTVGPGTVFGYINADDRFQDYQGDEIYLARTLYDFEITTLPIPAGTYEVRFGFQPTPLRGVAQLYLDGLPTGIPLDLQITADDPEIGFEVPGSNPDDPEGFENDKMMRNRGYMKAPASFQVIQTSDEGGWYGGPVARNSPAAMRRILGIYTFDETTTHTFRAKAVKAGEFMLDYLEFVPVEVLEYEDVY